MKNAKAMFCVLIPLLVIGCSDRASTIIDTGIGVRIKNSVGQNLLDPAIPGHYVESDFKLYYRNENGNPELYDKPNFERSYGLSIEKSQDGEHSVLFIVPYNPAHDERVMTTLLEIKSIRIDTIKTQIKRNQKDNTIVDKVWLNDVLVWENESQREIEIVIN